MCGLIFMMISVRVGDLVGAWGVVLRVMGATVDVHERALFMGALSLCGVGLGLEFGEGIDSCGCLMFWSFLFSAFLSDTGYLGTVPCLGIVAWTISRGKVDQVSIAHSIYWNGFCP